MAGEHAGHRERLKKRFLAEGLEAFEPHQVLELALFFGLPYRDTNELAHQLIERFGSLSAVVDADMDQLTAVPGVGANTAVLLKFLPAFYKAYSVDKWTRDKIRINSTQAAINYLFELYADVREEAFYVLCLDTKNCLIKAVLLDEGTAAETGINARRFVETVLRHQASGIVMAHSHPSGNPQPSFEDICATKQVCKLLSPLGIRMHDHIIIAGREAVSFSSRGLLPPEE